jgi:DNA-binding GntR family transcriptional regulator
VPNLAPKPTRTDFMYSRLRADILGGRLAPGSRLKFPELCVQFDASVGVVREALIRLAEQGLVRSQAHQGFTVTPLSFDDLAELTDVRLEIEGLVLRRALADGDIAWESRVLAAHHFLERTPLALAGDPRRLSDAWAAAHAEFHQAVLDGCSSRRLRLIAAGLRDEAELYRRWSLPLGNEPDRDLPTEHRQLMEAALARDEEAAANVLQQHIQHTTRLLVDSSTPRALAGD